jgi:methionyl-tRNA formyltransferase
VPVLKPNHPREPEFQAELKALEPDCCPVVAYGAMLPQSALDIPRHGWVNLHFSLLPAYRGAAPVQRAVWAGEEISGATTFRIVKAMDAGPIFGTMTQALAPDETSGSLFEKLTEGGARLLVSTLDGIEDGSLEAREQPTEGVTYADKITVEDAQIDWTQNAVAIDRQIRACTPAPGAWTLLDGERFKVGPVTMAEDTVAPGELVVRKNEVLVGTGTTAVRLGRVKAFGKKEMPAADWARGVRLESGVAFE